MKAREFQVGDLVLKRIIHSTKEKSTGKLQLNCEGSYTMIVRGGNGSYTIVDLDEKTFGKQCNSFHLKRHYV